MENDEKQKKFEDLAVKRVTEACHKIDLVGNLSNRNSYHYTDKQVEEIFTAIDSAVVNLKEKFKTPVKDGKKVFKFEN